MNIELRKYKIIEELMKISDESILVKLEIMLKNYMTNQETIKHLVKPMRTTLDIDVLIKEQKYQGANKAFIDGLIDEMAIETPLEELLKILENE
ncbi:MAG: hypothetical protein ACPG5B_11250 [Chitinophagales bacterium]